MPFVPDQPTRGRFMPDAPQEPAAVQAGRGIMELPRQIGLAGRYALEGPAQVADILTEPIRNFVVNPIASALGMEPSGRSTSQQASALADTIGLPSPENANERVIGDASRLVAGTAGLAGAAGKVGELATGAARGVAQSMAQAPAQQAIAATGAGLAGGSVREAGGSPGAQFLAAIAGGLAAPTAWRAIAAPAEAGLALARRVFAPQDIEAKLQVELQRAGIDWKTLSAEARNALKEASEKAIYSGEPLDVNALRRLADFKNIGAIPTVGAITQNPAVLTQERNLAKQMANTSQPVGGVSLPQVENVNTQRVLQTLDGAAQSPLDNYATGQGIAKAVQAEDAARKGVENSLYSQARDSAGRSLELDRAGFVQQAFDNLQQSNRAPWLPSQVRQVLNTLAQGEGQFTVNSIDQLKTLLAQESRKAQRAGDGATVAAIADVRSALENVQPAPFIPQTGSAAPITAQTADRLRAATDTGAAVSQEALSAFDRARAFARDRRTWQESASFIEDALGGTPPDAFVDKHILRAPVEELGKLRDFVSADPNLRDGVRRQLLEFIVKRGSGDSDVVRIGSSKGMLDALASIGDRKLAMFFDPQEVQQIKSAVNVARYIQAQPAGSAVNNSNTAAMVWGRLSDLLLRAERTPVLGPLVAGPARGFTLNMSGRRAFDTADALMLARQRQRPGPMPLLLAAAVPRGDQ